MEPQQLITQTIENLSKRSWEISKFRTLKALGMLPAVRQPDKEEQQGSAEEINKQCCFCKKDKLIRSSNSNQLVFFTETTLRVFA